MNEIYKTISGFDNYEVSTFGNVRNIKSGRILKVSLNNSINGYYKVGLCLNGNKYTNKKHRLVAKAFIDNPDNKSFIDHIDNDKLNNHISNLRWCSNAENQQNSKLSQRNSSGVKGVSFDKNLNKWQARIQIDGIRVNLGYYLSLDEAKQARITKANIAFGAFINACEKI